VSVLLEEEPYKHFELERKNRIAASFNKPYSHLKILRRLEACFYGYYCKSIDGSD